MKKIICLLLIVLTLCSCSTNVSHSNYNLISNFESGSNYDTLVKEYAKALGQEVKKPVCITNAKTNSQLTFANDGYTIFIDNKLSNNYFKLTSIAEDPFAIVVKADSIYSNMEKLLTAISRNPNKIEMAYKEQFKSSVLEKCGYFSLPIIFETTNDCIDAVINENAIFSMIKLSEAKEKIDSGEILLICTISSQRSNKYPQVPSINEIITESDTYINNPTDAICVFVNDKIPNHMKEFLISASSSATKDLAFNQFLEENGYIKLF